MREIKFRAWNKQENEMVDWAWLMSIGYGPNRLIDKKIDDNVFNDPDFILMQFTGLKDKNGKEIYEGDIVRDNEYRRLTVQFNTEGDFYGLCFQGIITIFQNPSPQIIDKYNIEVIGNIHENPNLPKGE